MKKSSNRKRPSRAQLLKQKQRGLVQTIQSHIRASGKRRQASRDHR